LNEHTSLCCIVVSLVIDVGGRTFEHLP
jgi:hypothetical protein